MMARIRGGIGADDQYWDALEQGEFKISRCAECRTWIWPAHYRCAACGSWDIQWESVAPEGTIYTWTRNHAVSDAIKERREDLPYVTLLVELPGAGGARVYGVLNGNDANFAIGDKVVGAILPPQEKSKGYATIAWTLVDAVAPEGSIS